MSNRKGQPLQVVYTYRDGRLKLFKEIVLARWCDEYDDALKSAHDINLEIDELRVERAGVIRKFTKDQINYEEKETITKAIDDDIESLKEKKIEADYTASQREKIVDNALLFIKDPSEFWNRAPIQIQKRVQRTIFPQGLAYDFQKGFGTIHLNDSYLLINKITPKGDPDHIVVAATGIEPVTSSL